jgi:hypothetical protein
MKDVEFRVAKLERAVRIFLCFYVSFPNAASPNERLRRLIGRSSSLNTSTLSRPALRSTLMVYHRRSRKP